VASVQVDGNQGVYYLGTPPMAAGSLVLDPLSVDEANSTIIPGGSISVPVQASAAFSTIYVVANQEGEGADGYFEVLLPASVTEAVLVLTYQLALQAGATQQVDVQVGSVDGAISASNSASFQTTTVATGELQVSVSWDKESDVDLYLVEPDGEQISFANERSVAGSKLDLDSNTVCNIDGIKNENISYEGVTPPVGTYSVAVKYSSACNQGNTNYVVTVQNGGVFSTFTGTLSTTSEQQDVTTFEVR